MSNEADHKISLAISEGNAEESRCGVCGLSAGSAAIIELIPEPKVSDLSEQFIHSQSATVSENQSEQIYDSLRICVGCFERRQIDPPGSDHATNTAPSWLLYDAGGKRSSSAHGSVDAIEFLTTDRRYDSAEAWQNWDWRGGGLKEPRARDPFSHAPHACLGGLDRGQTLAAEENVQVTVHDAERPTTGQDASACAPENGVERTCSADLDGGACHPALEYEDAIETIVASADQLGFLALPMMDVTSATESTAKLRHAAASSLLESCDSCSPAATMAAVLANDNEQPTVCILLGYVPDEPEKIMPLWPIKSHRRYPYFCVPRVIETAIRKRKNEN